MGAARRASTPRRLSLVKPMRSTAMSISERRMSAAISWSLLSRTSMKCSNAASSRRRAGELSFCPNDSAVISKRDLSCCFEQAGRQISRRVLVEVGREVGDAKAIVGIGLALPERRIGRLLLHVTPGALQLLGGRRGDGDDGVRQAQRFFGSDHGQKLRRLRRQIRPVANAEL